VIEVKTKKVFIITSDLFKTRFMQDADVFEEFKVVVNPTLEATVIKGFGSKNVRAIKTAFDAKNIGLVAIYDANRVYYRDATVKILSDGSKWIVLDDILSQVKSKKLVYQL